MRRPPWFDGARADVMEWCKGRSWLARAPLLLWMVYLGSRHLLDTDHTSLLGALNLGIHEAGHLLFQWFSWDFLTAAGGTILQIAAPVASAWMFARQPDYFACAFCGSWLATNLYHVATYAADARELDLPLVSVGGGEVSHDWNCMLSSLGLLSLDASIAFLFRAAAFLAMWGSVAAGAWMLRHMSRAGKRTLSHS